MFYPTTAKLVAALFLAALALVVSGQVMAHMPLETDFGAFVPVNIALGLAVGWLWLGPRAGEGPVTAVSNGVTAAFVLLVVAVFLQGANEMMRQAMLNRYGGPFEAVGAIFVECIELARLGLSPASLATLGAGGLVAGLLTEWTARRFS